MEFKVTAESRNWDRGMYGCAYIWSMQNSPIFCLCSSTYVCKNKLGPMLSRPIAPYAQPYAHTTMQPYSPNALAHPSYTWMSMPVLRSHPWPITMPPHPANSQPWLHTCHFLGFAPPHPPFALVISCLLYLFLLSFVTCLLWGWIFAMWSFFFGNLFVSWARTMGN